MSLPLRALFASFGIVFASAYAADATVHRVRSGESIQAAIDAATPGDTILVEPGTYQETANAQFGLRISTDNLRLIGKSSPGKLNGKGYARKVRLLHTGSQLTGVYAAPPGCGPELFECPEQLQGFYIRGFTVEGFPSLYPTSAGSTTATSSAISQCSGTSGVAL